VIVPAGAQPEEEAAGAGVPAAIRAPAAAAAATVPASLDRVRMARCWNAPPARLSR
jgi:hypothetical protein